MASFCTAGFTVDSSRSPLGSLHRHINRGFGGHEELADVGIIHMNGRVYDAKLGRFASADPHIQAPHNSQSYNRYTYVLNNPLKYTDPSGFFFKKLLKGLGITKLLKALPAEVLMVASIAAAVMLGPLGPWAMASSNIANGAIAGFVSGFIGSGGSLKAGVVGALSGAAFVGIGDKFAKFKDLSNIQKLQKIGLHGLTGGASSVANGGKFGAGFMSAGFTQAMSVSGGFDKLGVIEAAKTTAERAHNAIIAGLVGGTASVIGGGKFANGAQSAVMSRLFNDVAHAKQDRSCGGRPCVDRGDGASLEETLNVTTGVGSVVIGGAVCATTGPAGCAVIGAPMIASGVNDLYEAHTGQNGLEAISETYLGSEMPGKAASTALDFAGGVKGAVTAPIKLMTKQPDMIIDGAYDAGTAAASAYSASRSLDEMRQ